MVVVKKSIQIFLTCVCVLFVVVGCDKNSNNDGVQKSIDGSEVISQANTRNNAEINITREQANKLFSTLVGRGHNQKSGMYHNILEIVHENELELFKTTIDGNETKYYYTSYKCGTESFLLIYNTDPRGNPNDCVGMICFDDIIQNSQISNVKLLKDIYNLEVKNVGDDLIFNEHLDLLSTFRELDLNYDFQQDNHLSLHCADDGLYILEYEPDVFKDDYNLNMDCKVVSVHKYEDGIISEIYKRFINI